MIPNNPLFFLPAQVFQVRKVVGAAAGKIFAMKVLKKVFSSPFSLVDAKTQS